MAKFYEQTLPKVANLTERLEKLWPFRVDKDTGFAFETKKTDPVNTSFSWVKDDVLCLGKYNGLNGTIDNEDGEEQNVVPTYRIREYITLHEFGYHALFKPSLAEVAVFLPQELFDDFEKFWVMTEPVIVQGDTYFLGSSGYAHVGRTKVVHKC
ncbi:hypothetical protein GMAR_ORF288 [Golden Marseillevirus]|uniref:hypothetical protein n=1 Tax=Golden Marseillevirus TaxID=1720526 RepID=UPI000877ADB1|nr:hypothetical protein GMAR_ORF288 [Golden Marseillevirus]ALX27662.1 hypothetical protein GMAR_ORF288 [Golden Marseillevirus]